VVESLAPDADPQLTPPQRPLALASRTGSAIDLTTRGVGAVAYEKTDLRHEERLMSQVARSAVVQRPIGEVWDLVRDFNNYPKYIQGVSHSRIEDGRPGDAVGAVRAFVYGGATIRQRLSALSDDDHFFTYVGLDPFPFPANGTGQAPEPIDYSGTLRLTEISDGGQATFVEWQVAYEGSAATEWPTLLCDLIDQWIDSLRRTVER
jgi:hypothetical protein